MAIEVLMPALSPTMTEGNLAKWHKREGDTVSSGDILAEIETDKATMEVEAVDDGVLGRIIVAEGAEGIAVNTPIAIILEEGEDASALEQVAKTVETPTPPAPVDKGEKAAVDRLPADTTPPPAMAEPVDGRVFASPLARRMAQQAGFDLTNIKGSGPHGRIIKRDIDSLLATGHPPIAAPVSTPTAAAPALAVPAADLVGLPDYLEIPHSTMRKVIARRLVESKREAPHFYLTVDCEIDRLWHEWQQTHPGQNPTLIGADAVMDPWPETVDQVLDIADLNYSYE